MASGAPGNRKKDEEMKAALKGTTALAGLAFVLLATSVSGALAQAPAPAPQTAPAAPGPAPPPPRPPRPPVLKMTGYVDGGITFNSKDPNDGVNYGRLYDDRAN